MSRKKRGSTVLETARKRLAGLKSITPAPTLGPELNLDTYEQDINKFSASLDNYNEMLSALDTTQNNLDDEELSLRDKTKRILATIGGQYGTDSSQYEAAGGTRDSEHAPRIRKPAGNKSTPQT